jgi:hypothetical protein
MLTAIRSRALEFFDRIGWLTPLKPKEQPES